MLGNDCNWCLSCTTSSQLWWQLHGNVFMVEQPLELWGCQSHLGPFACSGYSLKGSSCFVPVFILEFIGLMSQIYARLIMLHGPLWNHNSSLWWQCTWSWSQTQMMLACHPLLSHLPAHWKLIDSTSIKLASHQNLMPCGRTCLIWLVQKTGVFGVWYFYSI